MQEKRIYELKKKNQELEKFKFVLDYKIKELKKQIEPRENEIKQMKEQIQEMESELERFHKQNTTLELTIAESRQRLKATERELAEARQRAHDVESRVRRFQTDLHNCVGYIQDPKMLKDSIVALYRKHAAQDTVHTYHSFSYATSSHVSTRTLITVLLCNDVMRRRRRRASTRTSSGSTRANVSTSSAPWRRCARSSPKTPRSTGSKSFA